MYFIYQHLYADAKTLGQSLSHQFGEVCNTRRQQEAMCSSKTMGTCWMGRRAVPTSGAGKDFRKDRRAAEARQAVSLQRVFKWPPIRK